MHLELTSDCEVLRADLWGKVDDDRSRRCLSRAVIGTPSDVARAAEWSIDFPLSDPAFISSPQGEVEVTTKEMERARRSPSRWRPEDWAALSPGGGVTLLVPLLPRCRSRNYVMIGGIRLLRPAPAPNLGPESVLPTVDVGSDRRP